jgi:hypothetical protein
MRTCESITKVMVVRQVACVKEILVSISKYFCQSLESASGTVFLILFSKRYTLQINQI